MVETIGETAITELDSPLCHRKEDPPFAFKIADSPKQMVPSFIANPDLSTTEMEPFSTSLTLIVPFAIAFPQPPVKGML